VLYPPVDIDFDEVPKEPLILSVGRFSTLAHTKKQLEMMRAFRDLANGPAGSWTYASVGGLNTRPENQAYFDQVRQDGCGCAAIVEANLDRGSVHALFERARIFWHATGLLDDTDAHPELAEHFGIATVEAMASGCVPVVIDKGGQREIVEHGRTGFLWTTVDELKAYTLRLIGDDALRTRMAAAARQRARQFGRERFVDGLSRACHVDAGRDAPDRSVHTLRASAL
jgi:glycosyltransferase involved in cell wall biosynthesis